MNSKFGKKRRRKPSYKTQTLHRTPRDWLGMLRTKLEKRSSFRACETSAKTNSTKRSAQSWSLWVAKITSRHKLTLWTWCFKHRVPPDKCQIRLRCNLMRKTMMHRNLKLTNRLHKQIIKLKNSLLEIKDKSKAYSSRNQDKRDKEQLRLIKLVNQMRKVNKIHPWIKIILRISYSMNLKQNHQFKMIHPIQSNLSEVNWISKQSQLIHRWLKIW